MHVASFISPESGSSKSKKKRRGLRRANGGVLRVLFPQHFITTCFHPEYRRKYYNVSANTNYYPSINKYILLLGVENPNYDHLELKCGIANNSAHLPDDFFLRAGNLIKTFAIQGVASHDIGNKTKHQQLHVDMCLCFPPKPGDVRKLNIFFRDFILSLI